MHEGFAPVKIRWLKTIEGVPVFTGIKQIVAGEVAVLDPSEAGRAIASGLAEQVVLDTPKAPAKRKAKETS